MERLSPFKIPKDTSSSYRVTDAEEEIFLLYCNKPTSSGTDYGNALGMANNARESHVQIDIPVRPMFPLSNATNIGLPNSSSPQNRKTRKQRKKAAALFSSSDPLEKKSLSVTVSQNFNSLQNRSGDTGSVVWRACLLFAELIISLVSFPQNNSFFDPEAAANAEVYEVGSGTGLLALVLSKYFKKYTCSDQGFQLRLIAKNLRDSNIDLVEANGNVEITELDWTWKTIPSKPIHHPQVILAIECLFNEALVSPFLRTIFSIAGKETTIVILAELRSESILREFLTVWLSQQPLWRLYHVNTKELGSSLGNGNYVLWMGCYESDSEEEVSKDDQINNE